MTFDSVKSFQEIIGPSAILISSWRTSFSISRHRRPVGTLLSFKVLLPSLLTSTHTIGEISSCANIMASTLRSPWSTPLISEMTFSILTIRISTSWLKQWQPQSLVSTLSKLLTNQSHHARFRPFNRQTRESFGEFSLLRAKSTLLPLFLNLIPGCFTDKS